MKRILVLLALASLVTGLLGSCKKDDPDNPDPQGDKTFEEIVKNLPGVYLSADYYDECGYARIVNLKEDGTTEQYYFCDNDVWDGIDVDENYRTMKGTWTAFKVEDIPSKTGFICNLIEEGDPDAEAVADTNYLVFNDKDYVLSTYFGYDEFFKVNQTFDEFKSKENLEAFLPGHLKETELTKSSEPLTKSYTTPPTYLKHWMADLPDDLFLCDISIPGSHDALSYRCTSSAQSQTQTIEEQWDWGIRFFDIRYYKGKSHKKVYPCHGKFDCHGSRDLSEELSFLEARVSSSSQIGIVPGFYKKEGAIIWLKCERYLDDKEKTEWCRDWIKNNVINKDIYIPFRKDLKVGDIRGKIVVLTRSDKWNEWAGYHEPDPIKYIQDDYNAEKAWGITIEDKSHEENNKRFLECKPIWFEEMLNNRRIYYDWQRSWSIPDNDGWLINHCSGYYMYYRPVEYSENAYPVLLKVLQNHGNQTYGIVPMDFVGRNGKVSESITAIVDLFHAYTCGYVYTKPLIEQIVKSNDIFKK